jgi:DHA3 family tetracycline resistance protein-like MFS transporter
LKKLNAYPVYLILEGSSSFLFALAFTFNLVYQTTVAGLSPLQLVLVGTTLESSVFLFEVPTGIVADVYSRRLSILIGVFLIGLGIALEGSFPLFITILLAQVLWGIGYTFTSGATQAWITDEIGEQAAGPAFLRASQAGQVGGLLGIAVSMALANVRVNLPIVTSGLLFLLLGGFLLLFMPELGFKPTPREQRNTWQSIAQTFRGGLGMVRRRPALLTILAVGLFYGLYSEGFDRLWVKLILDNFSLPHLGELKPVIWFGIINASGLLLSMFATEITRRRLDTNSPSAITRGLLGLSAGLIAGLVTFALSGSFLVALLALWVIDVTRSVISPIYTTWVNQRLDSQVRATVISMSSQVDAIGQIAGGPALGLIGNMFSVRAAIGAAALLLSPVLAIYLRAIQRSREAPIGMPQGMEEPGALETSQDCQEDFVNL